MIGLVLATFIISVVFFWDKISTTVKIACVVIAILAGLFLSNSENIIAYLATNKISLALNAIVIIGFGIVNYFLYKYTDNGLLSNVSQILSVLFIARWIYLYAFKFYGSSGVTTFTTASGPMTGSESKPIRPPTDFYNYLTDINFYCETIKSLFTGIIRYFLLAVFLFYAWFTFYIYYKNSFEFLTTYKTLSILGFLTIGFILLLLVIYSLSGGSGVEQTSPYVAFISKIGAYFAGFAVVMGIIIYALSKIMSIPSTTVQIVSIVNFLLLMGLVALILSIFNFNTSSNLTISSNNGLGFIFDFIVKLVLYIPCFIIDCSNVLREQLQLAKKEYTVVIILLIEIALIALESGAVKVNGAEKSAMLLVAAVPNSKLVLAPAAFEAPVPPFASAIVVPFQTPEVIVPTLVRLDSTIVDFKEVPDKVVASAVTVISALPSNAIPLIFFEAANFVAVAALPVVL